MELKLGKLPPVLDKRTIKVRSLFLKELPPLPAHFDNHDQYDIDDNFMFANNEHGCCVISARGHQTLVLEAYEQGEQIEITDEEIKKEYFEQTGGADNGLVLLWSIRDWKNDGWIINGDQYTIYAFASVDWKDHEEVKQCIHLLGGVNAGMNVYQADHDQFLAGEDWHLTDNDGELKGGHGIYAFAYDSTGVWIMTWGKAIKATWAFWNARIDECYGVVDNRNHADSFLDVEKLDGYLQDITEGRGEPQGCLSLLLKIFGW